MKPIKITLIQTSLFWEDCEKNITQFTDKINAIKDRTDLIILPEMFSTGFTMNAAALAESMDGHTVQWLKEMAKEKNCAVTGSVIIKENNKFYNRQLFVTENAEITCYDKRHLFRMANEHEYFTPGNKRIIINYRGWRICLMICYDLRFPVWNRNQKDYDLLLFIASWPEVRIDIWSLLLKARAIENQVYVAGVNRIGVDGKNMIFSGNSGVYSPKGLLISTIQPHENKTETVEISMEELEDFRIKYPVELDADTFEIKT